MKAVVAAATLLVLVACSTEAVPKPTATANIGWSTIPLKLGSYTWASGSQIESADMADPVDLLRSRYLVPVRVAGGCKLSALAKFSTEPKTIDVQLLYSTTGTNGPVPTQDHEFDIASATGTYVYTVTGTWPQGDVSFLLPLDVIPGCE